MPASEQYSLMARLLIIFFFASNLAFLVGSAFMIFLWRARTLRSTLRVKRTEDADNEANLVAKHVFYVAFSYLLLLALNATSVIWDSTQTGQLPLIWRLAYAIPANILGDLALIPLFKGYLRKDRMSRSFYSRAEDSDAKRSPQEG